jgi:hypothetical protein
MTEEQYLAKLASEASNYDDTLGNYDFDTTLTESQAYDAIEVENFLYSAKRQPKGVARKLAERIVKNPRQLMAVKEDMRRQGVAAGFTPATQSTGQGLAAQFDIKVTRTGTNTAAALPVAIFGAFDSASAYKSIISQFLPAGVTLTDLTIGGIGNENRARFEFTKTGVATADYIDVTINQYEYPSFIEALKTSRFVVSNARYSVSDTSASGLQQLTQTFKSFDRSMFGALLQNDIPLSSAKTPYQNQPGIVDINGTFNVNAQSSWVLLFGNYAQEVTISAFVAQANKGLA